MGGGIVKLRGAVRGGKGELALGEGTLGEPLLGKGELALGKGGSFYV